MPGTDKLRDEYRKSAIEIRLIFEGDVKMRMGCCQFGSESQRAVIAQEIHTNSSFTYMSVDICKILA